MSNKVFTKTRIAPTPSGYLHVGNILSFGITAALAKKHNAQILLRIDDLDKVRANPAFVEDIFTTLNFLGVEWHEGPLNAQEFEQDFSQMNRMALYNAAIEQLRNEGQLFTCTCSRTSYNIETCTCRDKGLSLETESANWRIFSDKCQLTIKEVGGTVVQATLPDDMQNFIVRKKDGFPSYQLASVVDDLHYGVDLIVRGQDLWESTLAQHFLAQELGKPEFCDIAFYHHPLVTAPSGEKLSKSAGDTSIKYLRESGISTAQVFSEILKSAGIIGEAKTWHDFIAVIGIHFQL